MSTLHLRPYGNRHCLINKKLVMHSRYMAHLARSSATYRPYLPGCRPCIRQKIGCECCFGTDIGETASVNLSATVEEKDSPQDSPQETEPTSPTSPSSPSSSWCIVNFYHLSEVSDPQSLVEAHRKWIEDENLDIRGRIYFSTQGVNAQFGGLKDDCLAYTEKVRAMKGFQGDQRLATR